MNGKLHCANAHCECHSKESAPAYAPCTCASFATVRGEHKKDCPQYNVWENGLRKLNLNLSDEGNHGLKLFITLLLQTEQEKTQKETRSHYYRLVHDEAAQETIAKVIEIAEGMKWTLYEKGKEDDIYSRGDGRMVGHVAVHVNGSLSDLINKIAEL